MVEIRVDDWCWTVEIERWVVVEMMVEEKWIWVIFNFFGIHWRNKGVFGFWKEVKLSKGVNFVFGGVFGD